MSAIWIALSLALGSVCAVMAVLTFVRSKADREMRKAHRQFMKRLNEMERWRIR